MSVEISRTADDGVRLVFEAESLDGAVVLARATLDALSPSPTVAASSFGRSVVDAVRNVAGGVLRAVVSTSQSCAMREAGDAFVAGLREGLAGLTDEELDEEGDVIVTRDPLGRSVTFRGVDDGLDEGDDEDEDGRLAAVREALAGIDAARVFLDTAGVKVEPLGPRTFSAPDGVRVLFNGEPLDGVESVKVGEVRTPVESFAPAPPLEYRNGWGA